MEMIVVALGVVAILLTTLALGVWVFAALALAAILSLWGFGGFGFERIGLMMSKILFRASNSWELAAIPLFILMGELIFRSDISERLFRGLAPLTRYLPGGLLHMASRPRFPSSSCSWPACCPV
ncbi:TRAP transporter large permease subunit [Stutzerimonas stutzeri]|uniref:TRAP transporter large permease subunit n=1 Tax=Stutzerimonas stutzeri TaxID=316 RepID=UPI0037165ECC